MIQFNLLPDVKVEYLKTKRLKRVITIVAVAVIAVCSVILISLFSIVLGVQPRMLSNLDKSIKGVANDIKSTQDINKVLTIQNQLTQIDALHDGKPRIERLFTYITQITPRNVSVESFDVDLLASKIEVKGQALSIEEMNKYIDTLKFTTINYGDNTTPEKKAFPKVVLNSYSINAKGAGFGVSLTYEPDIFKSDKTNLKLVVPKITSTRSETERPTDLFKTNLTPTGEGTE